MKLFFVAAIMLFSGSLMAQNSADIKFNEIKHSFGKIKQGVPASTTFVVTNNGTKPLIIQNAGAECGCTSPEWTKAPIMKGKSGTVKATFNAASPGPFTKRVTVTFANVKDPVVLTIEGTVVDPKVKAGTRK